MHEASVTEALLRQVEPFVPADARLIEVRLAVGELEHLAPEVMETMWAAATEGGPLAGSRLEIRRVALRVRCGACGGEYRPEDPAMLYCPSCHAVRPEILAGDGILLESLEVEE